MDGIGARVPLETECKTVVFCVHMYMSIILGRKIKVFIRLAEGSVTQEK